MTTKIAPYLAQIPIGKASPSGDVLASADLIRWLETLVKRVGGTAAPTNVELSNSLSVLAASDMVMQPSVSDQSFPDVMQSFDATTFDEITFQH